MCNQVAVHIRQNAEAPQKYSITSKKHSAASYIAI